MVANVDGAAAFLVGIRVPELFQMLLGRATSDGALVVVARIGRALDLLLAILTPLVLVSEGFVADSFARSGSRGSGRGRGLRRLRKAVGRRCSGDRGNGPVGTLHGVRGVRHILGGWVGVVGLWLGNMGIARPHVGDYGGLSVGNQLSAAVGSHGHHAGVDISSICQGQVTGHDSGHEGGVDQGVMLRHLVELLGSHWGEGEAVV
jgi:hypothetical protein